VKDRAVTKEASLHCGAERSTTKAGLGSGTPAEMNISATSDRNCVSELSRLRLWRESAAVSLSLNALES